MFTVAPEKATCKPGDMSWTSDECRKCGRYAETGKHVALACIHGEEIGRKWGTWEAMDEPKRWRKKVKDPDGDYELDLVEEFFANLDLA